MKKAVCKCPSCGSNLFTQKGGKSLQGGVNMMGCVYTSCLKCNTEVACGYIRKDEYICKTVAEIEKAEKEKHAVDNPGLGI
jgi:hypothetical protein